MRCNNCNTENLPEARFCRKCGNPLSMETGSIIDQFPEYDFILAVPYFEKLLKQWKTGIIFNSILIGPAIYNYNRIYKPLKKFLNDHRSTILYIQNPKKSKLKVRKYVFYVDNNKRWGLLKVGNQITIEIHAKYDCMKWRQENKLIEATSGNQTIIMDTSGNIYK